MYKLKLAIEGGQPIRIKPMPNRKQFDEGALLEVKKVFDFYSEKDFGTQGVFKQEYIKKFLKFLKQETGFVEVVASGTLAIYTALKSLDLAESSEILVSPITDVGMITPLINLKLKPKIIDLDQKTHQVTLDEIQKRYSPAVKAVILNHLSGLPIPEIKEIRRWCDQKNLFLIEDASQAHGAEISAERVGTFGHIACFSTMFSKNHSTGGAGGVIYTSDKNLFKKIILCAQKGKPLFNDNFNEKNPDEFVSAELNFGVTEISHALGSYTLSRLEVVNQKRRDFLSTLQKNMKLQNLTTQLLQTDFMSAPYFAIFLIDPKKLNVSKIKFAQAVLAEGISINPDYRYNIFNWPWCKNYLADEFAPQNALNFQEGSFNLLFNENYAEAEALDIVQAIKKVEQNYLIK